MEIFNTINQWNDEQTGQISVPTDYTEEHARKLGVVGWVRNTRKGTVDGQVQGKEELVELMKHWLSKVGSPSSRIYQAHFTNEKEITKLEFTNFTTRY
ncbi:acylphosphatase-2-like isoform X4 [Narcine bancroftii]|uniref:acylphosphatase-2-like isoform X4 n=1 Tax=Narcine bancroftii TaxID=1343680 RepID=UPI003831B4C9